MKDTPIFFERNRVGRVYTGGKLFGEFFGDEPIDGFEPEEWIASAVKAANKISKGDKEGVSKIEDSTLYFDDLLKECPDELLGKGNAYRILVKGLDSAIRLPAQAHPDKAFSKKYFNSSYGKTECWIILATRDDAKLFFGFKEGVTKEVFSKAIDESLTDKETMEHLMCEITPKAGEVYFVPAKTVHAIGKGCLILEVQEPTDFTIQPEHYCGDYKLNKQEMFMGLAKEEAISCFDFATAKSPKLEPKIITKQEEKCIESLVNQSHTDCFVINRILLNGGEHILSVDSYAVYIVTCGQGELFGPNYSRSIKKGDYFFMPANLMGKYSVKGSLQLIECF